jgi:hypothetical protein
MIAHTLWTVFAAGKHFKIIIQIMTNEQINFAIGEILWGWKETERWLNGTRCFEINGSDCGYYLEDLPNFCNDLNAMHEAEKLIGPIKGIELCWHLNNMGISGEWEILTVTAAQRAEAFLRTHGKWEE